MAGRKKKERNLEVDFDAMVCHCFGPLKIPQDQLEKREKIMIGGDEFQTLVDMDIENLTMQQGADKMGVSKTVYAGMYQQARTKVTYSLLHNCVLSIQCPGQK